MYLVSVEFFADRAVLREFPVVRNDELRLGINQGFGIGGKSPTFPNFQLRPLNISECILTVNNFVATSNQ